MRVLLRKTTEKASVWQCYLKARTVWKASKTA